MLDTRVVSYPSALPTIIRSAAVAFGSAAAASARSSPGVAAAVSTASSRYASLARWGPTSARMAGPPHKAVARRAAPEGSSREL